MLILVITKPIQLPQLKATTTKRKLIMPIYLNTNNKLKEVEERAFKLERDIFQALCIKKVKVLHKIMKINDDIKSSYSSLTDNELTTLKKNVDISSAELDAINEILATRDLNLAKKEKKVIAKKNFWIRVWQVILSLLSLPQIITIFYTGLTGMTLNMFLFRVAYLSICIYLIIVLEKKLTK